MEPNFHKDICVTVEEPLKLRGTINKISVIKYLSTMRIAFNYAQFLIRVCFVNVSQIVRWQFIENI